MNYFILILVGLAGVWLGRWLALRQAQGKHLRRIHGERHQHDEPLEELNELRRENKEEAKEKILHFIRQNGQAKNDDIEKLLGVSDTTATRYLQELEEEGRIIQKGETSGTYYELN